MSIASEALAHEDYAITYMRDHDRMMWMIVRALGGSIVIGREQVQNYPGDHLCEIEFETSPVTGSTTLRAKIKE